MYLKYDAAACSDGSGAQVQRIFATYSLAQVFKIGYLHSEILNLDFNPGDGIFTEKDMSMYRKKLNDFLKFLKKDEVLNPYFIRFRFLKSRYLFKQKKLSYLFYFLFFGFLNFCSYLLRKNYVLLISNPYPLIDLIPDSYRAVQKKINSHLLNDEKKIVSIQIHLVRAKVNSINQSERFTHDEWYIEILDAITCYLDSIGRKFEILIQTDVSENARWKIPPNSNESTRAYWLSRALVIENDFLHISTTSTLKAFEKYKNIKIVSGIDPVSAWEIISKADLFLMGKSSFSYVGAICNLNGLIVSPKFWHPPLRTWCLFQMTDSRMLNKICKSFDASIKNRYTRDTHH